MRGRREKSQEFGYNWNSVISTDLKGSSGKYQTGSKMHGSEVTSKSKKEGRLGGRVLQFAANDKKFRLK